MPLQFCLIWHGQPLRSTITALSFLCNHLRLHPAASSASCRAPDHSLLSCLHLACPVPKHMLGSQNHACHSQEQHPTRRLEPHCWTDRNLQQQERQREQTQLVYSGRRQGSGKGRGAVSSACRKARPSPPVGGALWPLAREQVLGLEVGDVSVRLALARHLAQLELRLVCGRAEVLWGRGVGGKAWRVATLARQTPAHRPQSCFTQRAAKEAQPGSNPAAEPACAHSHPSKQQQSPTHPPA